MKQLILSIFVLGCFLQNLEAQNIVAAEYFVNTDPGPGNASPISITPGATINQQFQLVAAYPAGINRLYVRVKGDAGIWSNSRTHFFHSMELENTSSTITEAEYFIDTDPGPGNATPVTVSPGVQLSVNLNIPVTIGEGIHRLYVRTKDQFGLWSNSRCQYFYVHPPNPSEQIVAAEYFVDADPGVGNGVSIPLSAASSLNEVFAFTNPFDQGTHTLSVRVKSADGIWSNILTESYAVCSVYGPVPQFDTFVSGNNVLINNNSQNVSSFNWSFGDGITSTTLVNPTHTYAAVGQYPVCLTVQNTCGTDQLCKQVTIAGLQSITPNQAASNGFAYINAKGFGFSIGDSLILRHSVSGTIYTANNTNFINTNRLISYFKFNNAETGLYDVILQSTTAADTLFGAFRISAPNNIPPVVTIAGRTQIRTNRTALQTVTITNPSNNAIFLYPLSLHIPSGIVPTFNAPVFNDPLVPANIQAVSNSVFYPYTNAQGVSSNVALIGIPNIPPGGSVSVPIALRATQDGCYEIEVSEWVQHLEPPNGPCDFLSPEGQCALSILGLVPVVSCGISTYKLTCTIQENNKEGSNKVFDLMENFGGAVADCLTPIATGAAFARVLDYLDKATDAWGIVNECGDMLASYEFVHETRIICSNASNDPNAKEGKQGRTPENYVNRNEVLNYAIFAENLAAATLPAAEVSITDTLDLSTLDLNSVEIQEIHIADSVYVVEARGSYYAADLDFQNADGAYKVRYTYALDTLSGVMTHRFLTLDTNTYDLPEDPLQGFLQPNVIDNEGEMAVYFTVKPKTELVHLTEIQNKASIVFDANAPILTQTWINTIDSIPPQSAISAVSQDSDGFVTLHFSSYDAHALTKDYFLSVSENNGPFQLRFLSIKEDSLVFEGNPSTYYQFKIQARDYANNLEPEHSSVDAEIALVTGINRVSAQSLVIYPNPGSGTIQLLFAEEIKHAEVQFVDMYGRIAKTLAAQNGRVLQADISDLAAGLYSVVCLDRGMRYTRKLQKQ